MNTSLRGNNASRSRSEKEVKKSSVPTTVNGRYGGGSSVTSERQNPSVRSVNEQIVKLNLDLEDAAQAIDLLKAAISKEEAISSKSGIDGEDRIDPLQKQLEEREVQHREELSEALEKIDRLLQNKRQLSEETKVLLQEVKAEQGRISVAETAIREEAAAEMERARKIWAEGEGLRREKWLERKTRDIREMTMRGLEPQVERIMERAAEEEREADAVHRNNMSTLKRTMAIRLDQAISAERARVTEEFARRRRATAVHENAQKESVIEEYNKAVERLRLKLKSELEAQQKAQGEELRKIEADIAAEAETKREATRRCISDLRRRHQNDAETAAEELEKAIIQLKEKDQEDRGVWEKQVMRDPGDDGDEEASLQSDRDARINTALRSIQKQKREALGNATRQYADMENKLRIAHTQALSGLADRQAEWVSRHGHASREMQSMLEPHTGMVVRAREMATRKRLLEGKLEKGTALLQSISTDLEQSIDREKALFEERRNSLQRTIQELTSLAVTEENRAGAVQESANEKLAELRRAHEDALENAHNEVRERISALDAQTARLKSELHSTETAVNHAKKMLSEYNNKSAKNNNNRTSNSSTRGNADGGSRHY